MVTLEDDYWKLSVNVNCSLLWNRLIKTKISVERLNYENWISHFKNTLEVFKN